VLDPVGHGINEGKDVNRKKKISIQWLAHVSVIFFWVLWGWETSQNK
jgi:hypothetical protein